MKKLLSTLIALCILFTAGSMAVYATQEDGTLTVTLEIGSPMMTVNGVQKEIDPGRGTAPEIINNRTLVPVRAIIEELGGTVTWAESTQTATLTYDNHVIQLTIGSTTAYFNGESYTLDVAPITINHRTMLPIYFIAERFAFTVDWNPNGQIVTMTKNAPQDAAGTGESRALILYFSATGTTRSLAERISEASGAKLFELVPTIPYTSEDLNYNTSSSRANQEVNSDTRPDIQPLSVAMEDYDVILLGYPIWWGQCPPPVLTFLESYDLSHKTIMPFCTSGSSGITGSLSKIRELCPDSTVTAGLRGTAATTQAQINIWLSENGFSTTDTSN